MASIARFIVKSSQVLSVAILFVMHSESLAQFNDLLKRVPGTANALVLIDVEKVHASPIAKRENWKAQQMKEFEAGLIKVPPGAIRFVMASELDFDFLESDWEVTLFDLDSSPDMAEVAKRFGGRQDEVNGLPAVLLPEDAYAIKFEEKVAGVMAPGSRQAVARWVRKAGSQLAGYLSYAVKTPQAESDPISLVLDLENVFPPNFIRERLKASETLKGRNVQLDKLVDLLAGLRGIRLHLDLQEEVFGEVVVEFRDDAGILSAFGKPLLLEALAKRGAMIDDFKGWIPAVSGSTFSMRGALSESGRRRVLSVIETPAPSLANSNAQSAEKGTGAEKVEASQLYFRAINELLEDLRTRNDAKTLAQYGVWFSSYARKIDKLPLLNVDADLLDYGSYVSEQLRTASRSVQNIGIQSAARQAKIFPEGPTVRGGRKYGTHRYGRYGRYRGPRSYAYLEGTYKFRNLEGERRAVRTEEKSKGATSVHDIFAEIENATRTVRREMVKRYQKEF